MNLLVMSDIHGNLSALHAVLEAAGREYSVEACILLGDIIDYGMHSNEVIRVLDRISYPVLCNIQGNHEYAVLHKDYSRFSTDRGKACARYTERILSDGAWKYLRQTMQNQGFCEFECGQKKCLAIHGSFADEYWKSIHPGMENLNAYRMYDYVFSGHSHIPHYFEKYFDTQDARMRNKKKVIFLNPGSVGQPRNRNNRAQFAVVNLETEQTVFGKVSYDIAAEQQAIRNCVDGFYSERLEVGI